MKSLRSYYTILFIMLIGYGIIQNTISQKDDKEKNEIVNENSSEDIKAWSVSSVPNTRLKSDRIHVSDPDDIIEAIYEDSINSILSSIREKTDIFVVALNRINNESGEIFANDLFNYWGIGSKNRDNGVLVLMTTDPFFIRIETGYGMEEILPDVVCHIIIQENVLPEIRQDRYDEGLLKCVKSLAYVVADVEYEGINKVTLNTLAQPLEGNVTSVSEESDNEESGNNDEKWDPIIGCLVGLWILGSFLLSKNHLKILYQVWNVYKKAKQTNKNLAYGKVSRQVFSYKNDLWLCLLFPLSFITGIWFLLVGWYFRRKSRICPSCSGKMHRLSENNEDPYLTEIQILEKTEKIKDYDVWVCECGSTFVDFYEGKKYSSFKDCPQCGAHMSEVISKKSIVSPSYKTDGVDRLHLECKYCHHSYDEIGVLPKLVKSHSSGGSGGGGRSGGSFGGGRSGGGGASGHR